MRRKQFAPLRRSAQERAAREAARRQFAHSEQERQIAVIRAHVR